MKNFTFLLMFAIALTGAYAQQKKEQHLNKETNLIEVTYYHNNDQVSQQGTFNLEGRLHGKWISYNEQGVKITEGSYDNGIKTGKWFFWSQDGVKEIIYDNNSIASINESTNKTRLVDKH
ncbi:toxin-antitoxin system YwqK family antitoxin [Lentiprolixibacter aurantiacus]|uniref:Nicotinic acid mononucleotide adenyltransferase n=1 Tax=Lentiprolixibacter aurantiacus TaxID=2993939 RepID=A0AAE3MKB6_9FLAO|nr:nicotinic acid mononucleotide adenyltransferase [Lentiprolixibacter aurantiacus]MCX2718717.1 nicotinic acid mononucleotide adenyltransferase [Lentiprolixibacter aurantiacus]